MKTILAILALSLSLASGATRAQSPSDTRKPVSIVKAPPLPVPPKADYFKAVKAITPERIELEKKKAKARAIERAKAAVAAKTAQRFVPAAVGSTVITNVFLMDFGPPFGVNLVAEAQGQANTTIIFETAQTIGDWWPLASYGCATVDGGYFAAAPVSVGPQVYIRGRLEPCTQGFSPAAALGPVRTFKGVKAAQIIGATTKEGVTLWKRIQ